MSSLAYDVTGNRDNPAVVIGHALGADRHMWDKVVPVLSRRYFVVRYDLPGHGKTAPRVADGTLDGIGTQVLDLMDELGLARSHHVGISLGGMVALWVAENAPGRVDRLVMVSSAAVLLPSSTWQERAATVRKEGTDAVIEGTLERWFTPEFSDTEALNKVRAAFKVTDNEAYAKCCEAISKADLREDLRRVEAPTLLLPGAKDPGAKEDADHEIIQAIHRGGGMAERYEVPDVAHASSIERPGAITARIVEFLDADEPSTVKGLTTRREVLGVQHVARAQETTNSLNADFQDFITRYAWGEVWSRPGLDRRTRSAVTLALLASHGHDDEFRMHVRAGLRNDLSVDEIREVILHLGIYVGVPVSNHAYRLAADVLRDEGYDL